MLQLTSTSGRTVERVFVGWVSTHEDLERFVAEMNAEVDDNHTGRPLLVEIWRESSPAIPVKETVVPRAELCECGYSRKLTELNEWLPWKFRQELTPQEKFEARRTTCPTCTTRGLKATKKAKVLATISERRA